MKTLVKFSAWRVVEVMVGVVNVVVVVVVVVVMRVDVVEGKGRKRRSK